MKSRLGQFLGIKPPFNQAAFCEVVAGLIFLVTLVWPQMSVANMIKGLLIGGFWAVFGFVQYLRALGESPRH